MLLAEALARRAEAQDRLNKLQERLVQGALMQEGDTPPEDPADMLALALRIGVNHDGDSDSTASLAGQVLGAAHGTAVFGAHNPADRAAAEASVPGWIAEREVVLEAARRWSAATT